MILMESKCDFERLFCPRSVAVIGASAKNKTKFGTLYIKANLDCGYTGKIYPVNLEGGEVYGLKIYKNLADIPDEVDLACIATPARYVKSALEECLAKKIPWAQIVGAGFSEMGEDGKRLEEELKVFPELGLRIIGPNCFGVHCPKCGLTIIPGGGLSREEGDVAFVGQSGGLAVDLGYSSIGLGFSWRRMVSYGNGCDIGAVELIQHFAQDSGTKVIVAYIEGVKNGRAFFEAVKSASATKPVIIWKGGLTESGARAVMSHTGSMGGHAEVWESALRQANAVQVYGQEQILDTVMGFHFFGDFRGKGVAVVGGGGALGVSASDSAEKVGLRLPAFSESTRMAMEEILPPPGTSFNNPADVGNPMIPAHILEKIMSLSAKEESIDAIILIQILHHMTFIMKRQLDLPPQVSLKTIAQHQQVAKVCGEVARKYGKPVIQVLPPIANEEEKIELEALLREARRVSHAEGVATYPTLERALSALARVSQYNRRKPNPLLVS